MKQIIPFKRDLLFTTKISEITSISLEHNLKMESNDCIAGEMLISGDYKITDASVNREHFVFNIPFEITLDHRYNIDNAKVDIDDFYYEIINDEILRINIDVSIDGVEVVDDYNLKEEPEEVIEEPVDEPPLNEEELVREENEVLEELENEFEVVTEKELEEEKERDEIMKEKVSEKEEEMRIPDAFKAAVDDDVPPAANMIDGEKIRSLFDSFDDKDETFSTYHVYIVRNDDTLESIMNKYNVTKEDLCLYNNVDELKIGDKIIIPKLRNE